MSATNTIDFVVGVGTDGNYSFDSTGIEATISAVDHFKCYDVVKKGPTPKRQVTLVDQFEAENAMVMEPVALCTPVDKNGEGINDPDTHLTCYKIKQREPFAKRDVVVQNQFGDEQALTVVRPRTLCVPSLKRLR